MTRDRQPDDPGGPRGCAPETPPVEAGAAPASRRRVLIVEDNETARKQIQVFLETDPGLAVDTAANGSDALKALTERPYSVIVTDLKMPRVDGLQLLEEVQKRRLPADVIITTGFGTIEQTVQAMRLGAVDFLTKPINLEHLRLVIQRALRERALQDEVTALREKLHEQFDFHTILSKSPRMHDVFELISHVAQTISTVLIFGETGTGKELVARAVHEASPRRGNPFVAVNCAALPESLLESELFGHEKGAFTSAVGQRKGRFELAHGGTIFLDEIGEVPLPMQAKLLRVLQERRFERVGGTQTVEVGRPRHRRDQPRSAPAVQGGEIPRGPVLPAQRREDRPAALARAARGHPAAGRPLRAAVQPPRRTPKVISPEAMELLLQHRWPGNIRELENAIERATVTSRDESSGPRTCPPRSSSRPGPSSSSPSTSRGP